MNVEEFRCTYVRLCKDHHIEPQDAVLSQITVYEYVPISNVHAPFIL